MATIEIVKKEIQENQIHNGDSVHCESFAEAIEIVSELEKMGIEAMYRNICNGEYGDFVKIINIPERNKDYAMGRVDGAADLAKAILNSDETLPEIIKNLQTIAEMGGKSVWAN